jgi:uncharacterized membrane protein
MPFSWTVAASVVVLAALLATASAVEWRAMAGDGAIHRFCGWSLVLVLLWSARADLGHGLSFQLLGVPLATLMLGPSRALWCAAFGLFLVAILREAAIGWVMREMLFAGVIPVLATELMRRAVAQWLPAHLFVYLLGVGFIGTGLVSMLAQSLEAWWIAASGTAAAMSFLEQYLPFLLLIGFAEATLGGMLLTLAVVYCPAWVASFADRHYFGR